MMITYRVNANHPIDIMKASIPINKPLWTLFAGAAPVNSVGVAAKPAVVLLAEISLGCASPRQFAILKKMSMLP